MKLKGENVYEALSTVPVTYKHLVNSCCCCYLPNIWGNTHLSFFSIKDVA